MHSRGEKKKIWHQSRKKVFSTKPKAWFIKPTGTIIHLAICRPNHRMSFLPKKQNSCKVRCAGKTKSSVPKSLCKQKGLVGSTSHEFLVLLHFYLLEKLNTRLYYQLVVHRISSECNVVCHVSNERFKKENK